MNRAVRETHFSSDVWERRFDSEGQLWGNEASPPAKYLTKVLEHRSTILEVGAGYGRDSNWFVENGHTVTAIDKATNALSIASDDLKEKIHSENVSFIISDFRRASMGARSQDAFFAHRLLHLLGNNGTTQAFADMAAKVLKPDGRLLVTARSFNDFNPNQMMWADESQGVAKYRDDIESLGDRRGQNLYFWNEERITRLFEDDFEDITVKEDTEMESIGNVDDKGKPVLTHYVSISARRKYTPAPR